MPNIMIGILSAVALLVGAALFTDTAWFAVLFMAIVTAAFVVFSRRTTRKPMRVALSLIAVCFFLTAIFGMVNIKTGLTAQEMGQAAHRFVRDLAVTAAEATPTSLPSVPNHWSCLVAPIPGAGTVFPQELLENCQGH